MNGITADQIDEYLDTHDGEVRSMYSENWTQSFGTQRDAWLSARLADVGSAYKEFLKGDIERQLMTYRVDYVFSGNGLSDAILSELPNLSTVEVLSGVHVYHVGTKQ